MYHFALELISHGTIFFSHNKSANGTFQPDFLAKQTVQPDEVFRPVRLSQGK